MAVTADGRRNCLVIPDMKQYVSPSQWSCTGLTYDEDIDMRDGDKACASEIIVLVLSRKSGSVSVHLSSKYSHVQKSLMQGGLQGHVGLEMR